MTFDTYWISLEPTYDGVFWSQGDYLNAENPIPEEAAGQVYCLDMMLDPRVEMHTRQISNVLDLLGELGGVLDVMVLLVFFFVAPVAEHSYFMAVFNKLYLAKTKSSNVFKNKKYQQENDIEAKAEGKDKKKHFKIQLDWSTNFQLFCM